MSDNSTNPLEGLPAPEKGAKPSPLNSDPGSLPDADRWWLKSSINPEEVPPESDAEDVEKAPEVQDASKSTVSADHSSTHVNAPQSEPTATEGEQDVEVGSHSLTFIILGLLALGITAAVLIFGGN